MPGRFVSRDGVDRLRRHFDAISDATDAQLRDALGDIGEDLLDKSLDIVPYDEGDLYGSGFVSPVTPGRSGLEIEIGYKANEENSIEKIIANHEDLDRNHPGGKEAKYLEKPFVENKAKYSAMIMDAGKRGLRG